MDSDKSGVLGNVSIINENMLCQNSNNSIAENDCKDLYHDKDKCSRKLVSKDWSKAITNTIRLYEKSTKLSDVVLIVGKTKFYCHRIVLASVSPYFSTIFGSLEKDQSEIVLLNIEDDKVMKQVIKYIYTGSVVINNVNMYETYRAADFFQILGLRKLCITYMKANVSQKNCIEMYQFAYVHKSIELMSNSGELFPYIVSKASNLDIFLKLPVDVALGLLNVCHTTYQHSPELEASVFKACVAWLKYDADRKIHAGTIFQSVSFIALRQEYFKDVIMKEKLVVECDEVMERVNKAFQFLETQMRISEIDIDYLSQTRTGKSSFVTSILDETAIGTIKGIIILVNKINFRTRKEENYLMNVCDNAIATSLCLMPSLMCGTFKSVLLCKYIHCEICLILILLSAVLPCIFSHKN